MGLVGNQLRASGFGQTPNEAGLMMVAVLPLALMLQRRAESGWQRIVNASYLVLGSIAVILTASRGAFVALVVCGILMVTLMRAQHRYDIRASLWLLALIGLGIAAAVYLVPDSTWDRIGTVFSMVQRMNLNNRTENWVAALAIFVERPLIGVGAGAFEGAAAHMTAMPLSSHSSWLGVIVELGLVGATIWFSALALMFARLWSAEHAVRRALLSSLIPMAIGMMIVGWDHRKTPWLIFTLCLCAGSVHVARLRVPAVAHIPASK